MDAYKEHGYANRKAYLRSVSEEYGVPIVIVYQAAAMLGEEEDFDGLISMVQDFAF
jgi:hypothetical protein